MTHKQHPSDEEIRSYMNFDTLLEKRKAAVETSGTKAVLKWGIPVVVVTALVVLFIYHDGLRPTVVQENGKQSAVSAERDSLSIKGHRPTENNQKIAILDSVHTAEPSKKGVDVSADKSGQIRDRSPLKEKEFPSRNNHESPPAASDYQQAEPIHGYSDLYQYFNASLVYPIEAVKDSIQGVQTISFIINVDGKPEHIEIIKSLGEPFEKEAKRLIENMPAWKPATMNGKPVASKVSLPLTFQIQKIKQ